MNEESAVDLEGHNVSDQGGGGKSIQAEGHTEQAKHGYILSFNKEKMSVCLEPNNMLTGSVGTNSTSTSGDVGVVVSKGVSQAAQHGVEAQQRPEIPHTEVAVGAVPKGTAKLVVANHSSSVAAGSPVLQKVVNPPLITVLNSSGPLTVVKTLCVTSGVSSAPQFTVVNSTPLTVTNTGKPPTITLLNGPLTVVKAIPGTHATSHVAAATATIAAADKCLSEPTSSQCNVGVSANHAPVPAIIENRTHNVFVKNTCPEAEMPQGHKLLTANNFPQSNVLNISTPSSKVNGQRNKLKILSNVMASTSQGPNNVILNKANPNQQRYMSRPKIVGPNGATATKYINKPPSNGTVPKTNMVKTDKSPQRIVYPTHKGQLKTLPPINNYVHKPQGIKTLPPQQKPMPGQIQRTGSGLRTIPPQKPPKTANKPNYIGKHAVQAQKMKSPHGKLKPTKTIPPTYGSGYHTMPMPDKQLTFNQALTAEILETLGNKTSTSSNYSYKNFETLPTRYDNPYCYEKPPQVIEPPPKPVEEKSKSGLDALSLICQAVLLDHNYNATLPPESPTRPAPQPSPQVNGVSSTSHYSPGIKRRSFSSSNPVSSTSSMSSLNLLPNSTNIVTPQDEDAASDISYGSDRKHDTEGEETDTAPEAEAVNNNEDAFDHYGDYVTRCICGFLHDDGYMIECDRCKVWQHVQCVIKNKQVPDEYLCEVCDPSKAIDRQKAKMMQQQWLRDRQFPDPRKNKDPKLKEVLKHREALSDTDSSDNEQPEDTEPLSKNETSAFSKTHCSVPLCESVKSKTVSLFRFPPSKGLCQKWCKALKIGKKITKYMLVCSLHFKETDFHPNTPFRLRKRLKANVVPSQNLPPRKNAVANKESGPGPNNNMNKGRPAIPPRRKSDSQQKNAPRQRRDATKEPVPKKQIKRRERKVPKRKPKPPAKAHSEEDTHQDAFSATQLPQLRQWIENYEEAVTNHYSPELRARISSIRVNGAHTDTPVQYDSSVHKCRVNTQPMTEIRYLVSTVHLPPNTPVVELRGKYMLSTQHRNSGGALTTRQHAQRPGPFLFFYRLHRDNTEVCVDTRTYGNSARFVRRSCRPNAELRHCIEKGVLHLYIVTINTVDKNAELTIKHESHDLAAIGTTHIVCACGTPDECTVNRGSTSVCSSAVAATAATAASAASAAIKKNGENVDVNSHRKRRGRRMASLPAPLPSPSQSPSTDPHHEVAAVIKQEVTAPPLASPVLPPLTPTPPPPLQQQQPQPTPPPPPPVCVSPPPAVVVKEEKKEPIAEPKEEEIKPVEVKMELEEAPQEIKQEIHKEPEDLKCEPAEIEDENTSEPLMEASVKEVKEEDAKSSQPSVLTRRSSSHHKADYEEAKEQQAELKEVKSKNKKLSREERKLEAILRAIEQMEKADQRKQENQAKQAHRRESEPSPNVKDDDRSLEPKIKRRRRKGRTRTGSSNSQSTRRNRINSTDSCLTSGDESMLSPNEGQMHSGHKDGDNKEHGQHMSASGREDLNKCEKSPIREDSNNSNSAHSSPETTQVSSACLLVQAAVEPLEQQGFKFPKTKKGLMNEWLNKVPEPIHSASSISPSSLTPHINNTASEFESTSSFYTANKSLGALAQAANYCESNIQSHGNAKKRWLRQAISEDQCDSPSRPESPPISEAVAPPKKRRLPRESLSNEDAAITTPIGNPVAVNKMENEKQEGCVEIVYSNVDGDSPTQTLESDAILKERAAEMKQEFSSCLSSSIEEQAQHQLTALSCIMDPRLSREHNSQMFNSAHLVGTVEKTLSILGFEDRKPEPLTPAKRKLSITEYRQRKKLNNNDGIDKITEEQVSPEENNSMESFKPCRQRSNSSSSSTSLTSSDEEMASDIQGKASAFNSEPTELERQRDLTRLRLKKAFGLSVDEPSFKSTLDVKTILNCELPPVVKPSIPLSSPTFPIPGSLIPGSINSASPKSMFSENSTSSQPSPVKSNCPSEAEKPGPSEQVAKIDESEETSLKPPTSPISDGDMSPLMSANDEEPDRSETPVVDEPKLHSPQPSPPQKMDTEPVASPEPEEDKADDAAEQEDVEPNMFYTPDEEEMAGEAEPEEVESMNYVPPFNNPIYPSSGFSAYTSAIDDDSRYESRNPSPPPDLTPSNFQEHQA